MLLILAFSAVAAQAPSVAAPCPGRTTPEVNACIGAELSSAETRWHRYSAAVTARINSDRAEDVAEATRVAAAFKQAEVAWTEYRAAECGAVFDYWSAGTIRISQQELCETRLTVLHTHAIWRDWLTYLDSTPPILPEPDIDQGLGRRAARRP